MSPQVLDRYSDEASCEAEPLYQAESFLEANKTGLAYCKDFKDPLPGHWLEDADPSKRQSFMTCPLIASQYACSFLGLRHGLIAERMRWSPRDCRLRPICGATLASIIRDRRLVVVGDSHARQLFSSIACKLFATRHVQKIEGPCNSRDVKPHVSPAFPFANASCIGHGLYMNDRVLCGPTRCTGGPMAPRESLQGGPAFGTNVYLRGGGTLHYREPYHHSAPPGMDSTKWGEGFYHNSFRILDAELRLTPNDIVVVSDIGAARHSHEPHVLRALAKSYLAASQKVLSHLIWVDSMASHFLGAPDGEFAHRPVAGHKLTRDQTASSCQIGMDPPIPYRTDLDSGTACRALKCSAQGSSNVPAAGPMSRAGLAVLHSFHATRLAHVAHSGISFTNHSKTTYPDCMHVCQPSGSEELRVSLLYNMLASGFVFATTVRRLSV
jgi:hypothetical protein